MSGLSELRPAELEMGLGLACRSARDMCVKSAPQKSGRAPVNPSLPLPVTASAAINEEKQHLLKHMSLGLSPSLTSHKTQAPKSHRHTPPTLSAECQDTADDAYFRGLKIICGSRSRLTFVFVAEGGGGVRRRWENYVASRQRVACVCAFGKSPGCIVTV